MGNRQFIWLSTPLLKAFFDWKDGIQKKQIKHEVYKGFLDIYFCKKCSIAMDFVEAVKHQYNPDFPIRPTKTDKSLHELNMRLDRSFNKFMGIMGDG